MLHATMKPILAGIMLILAASSCGGRAMHDAATDAEDQGDAAVTTSDDGASRCAPSMTACDPSAVAFGGQTGCPSQQACYLSSDAAGTTFCACPGEAAVGDPCDVEADCIPGLTCVSIQGKPKQCYIACKLSDNRCAPPYLCQTIEPSMPGDFGICR